jgi:hypothetical protein
MALEGGTVHFTRSDLFAVFTPGFYLLATTLVGGVAQRAAAYLYLAPWSR